MLTLEGQFICPYIQRFLNVLFAMKRTFSEVCLWQLFQHSSDIFLWSLSNIMITHKNNYQAYVLVFTMYAHPVECLNSGRSLNSCVIHWAENGSYFLELCWFPANNIQEKLKTITCPLKNRIHSFKDNVRSFRRTERKFAKLVYNYTRVTAFLAAIFYPNEISN